MSMMDPNMAMMYAPLASAAMLPQAAASAPMMAQAYGDDYRRRQAPAQSAAPRPGQTGPNLQQHFMQQKIAAQGQGQPVQPPAQAQSPRQSPGAPAPRQQDFNPAGVTLGNQYAPQEAGDFGDQQVTGRNVELIRGGQSQVQHFGNIGTNDEGRVTGDNQGTLPSASSGDLSKAMGWNDKQAAQFSAMTTHGIPAHQAITTINQQVSADVKAGKGSTPHQDFMDTKSQLDEAQKQLASLQKKGTVKDNLQGDQFDPNKLTPEEQQQHWALHASVIPQLNQMMNEHLQKLAGGQPAGSPAQAQPQKTQIPNGGGQKITPEVIDMISKLAKTKQEATRMAQQYGWSL